jgi:hypothetical protein
MEIKGNGKGYLRGAGGGFDGNRRKMVGGGCPGSITINDQNHEKRRKITKDSQNHQNYQKPSKSDGHQIPKLPKTTKT